MTLLYLDGFAHGDTSRYIGTAPSAFARTTSPARTSGASTYYGQSTNVGGDVKRAVTASSEIYTGAGLMTPVAGVAYLLMSIWGDSGATQHLTLAVTATGQLELRRGSATVIATGSTTLDMSGWHYYEIRATIADSGGVCQVWVDGATSPEINYSGDTKNAGTNTTIDAVSLRVQSSTSASRMADWYILNTAGSVNNTRLGDIVVRTLVPVGDGASSQLVGSDSDSVANWQLVDELPASSTDYVGSATSGQVDTYAMTDLPAGVTSVYGMQVSALMAKSDAGAATAKIATRVGSTNYVPDTTTLSTSYAWAVKMWDVDPTGTAWTPTSVNAAEIGMQVG